MSRSIFLFVLCFSIKFTIPAAKWTNDLPRCSTECPITSSPVLTYVTGMTYNYIYTGKSKIVLKDVAGGESEMEWEAQVKLTVLSPCDLSISIDNPTVGGAADAERAWVLERYPLVVAVADGRVQHVCSHPNDDTWSINFKKGIASAFQNSLPSNSSVNSGLNFTETDIVGKCSTQYKVNTVNANTIVVSKEKNHRYCQERYPTPDELPIAWLKAPLPVGESSSLCQQNIIDGVIDSVICDDRNVIRPSYGVYKYIETHQQSRIQYTHVSTEFPSSVSNLRSQQLVHKSLLYDYEITRKDGTLVPQLDEVMKNICEKIQENIDRDVATLMAKALYFLKAIPDEMIEQTLQKIRHGQYCSSYQRLESLFLDATAFIHEPGAVKVMVNELVSERATRVRQNLYTAAFFLTARPSKASIESLKPLFESARVHSSPTYLGASVMVSNYCRHNRHCHRETSIIQLVEIIGQKIQETCLLSAEEHTQKEALACLKALGNIGIMTPEVNKIIMSCLKAEKVETNVRVSAAHAFRNVNCKQRATRELVDIAVNPNQNTEIRIASYLAAVKCATRDDLTHIVSNITPEENDQVRGFILSHLLNLQESTAPHKESIRYHLANMIVPNNLTSDIRKYSRNIDLSYYNPSLGLGLGMESNIIYAPGSFIPRSIDLNLTSSVGGTLVNLGEYGIRIEELDPTLKDLFGPDGYLRKGAFGNIFNNIMSFTKGKGTEILRKLAGDISQKGSIDISHISDFLNKIYNRKSFKSPKVDLYARLNNLEATFASISGDPKNLNVEKFIQILSKYFQGTLYGMTNMDLDTAHMGQIYLEYYLPTIQGIPVKMKLDGTAVMGLKMESHLRNIKERNQGCILKIKPSISIAIDGFIGFDSFLAENGIRTKNLISSSSGVSVNVETNRQNHIEFNIDLPQKIEIVNLESEVYLMKKVRGNKEIKIIPRGIHDIRVEETSCLPGFEPLIGLLYCYSYNYPNVYNSTGLPLGRPTFYKATIELSEPNMRGYHVILDAQNNAAGGKIVHMKVQARGTSHVEGSEGTFSYNRLPKSLEISSDIKLGHNRYQGKFDVSNRDGRIIIENHYIITLGWFVMVRGFKIDFNDKSTRSKTDIEFNLHSGHSDHFPPTTHLIGAKFMKEDNGQEIVLEMACKTMNELADFLSINFEFDGALQLNPASEKFLPVRIHTFELHTRFRSLGATWFIRSSGDSVCASGFQVLLDEKEFIVIEGRHSLEGTPGINVAIKNSITAKFVEASYKMTGDWYDGSSQGGALFKILQGNDDSTVAHFEMSHGQVGTIYKTMLRLNIPSSMRSIDFQSVALETESHTYHVAATLKHGSRLILQYEGPVTIMLTSKDTHFQTDVSISSLAGGPYGLATTIIFSENKQLLALSLTKEEALLFAIGWSMAAEESQEVDFGFYLQLRSIINNRVNANVGRHFFHASFDNVISPESQGAVRSKGFADVDFASKKVSGEVSWDADRNPSRKISAEAIINSRSSTLRQSVISGGWNYMGKTYSFKSELDIKDPQREFIGNNIIKTKVTTPDQKNIVLETECRVQREHNDLKVSTATLYKNTDNKSYKLNTVTLLNDLAGKFNYMLTSDIRFSPPPETKETVLHLEARHQTVAGLGEIFLMMNLSNPEIAQPLEIAFTVNKMQHSYNAVWKIEIDTPAKGASFEVIITPEKGLKTFDMSLDLTAIYDLLEALQAVLHLAPLRLSRSGTASKRFIYHIRYHQSLSKTSTVTLEMPSRTMECEVRSSPSECNVMVYFNKGKSDDKYELMVKKSHHWSLLDQQLRLEGRFRHPRSPKDLLVDVQYQYSGHNITGKFELDIFSNSEDKITGLITSMPTSDDSVKIEADITGRLLEATPRILLSVAQAPHTKAFDLAMHITASQTPAIFMAGKLDRTGGRNVAVAFNLATEGLPVISIAGAVSPGDSSRCDGLKITGASHCQVIGNYDFDGQVCLPGGIQGTAKNLRDGWSYGMNLGMQGLRTAEISIDVEDPAKLERRSVVMAQAMITTPRQLSLKLLRDSEELMKLKKAAAAKGSKISQEVKNWLKKAFREIFKDKTGNSPPFVNMALLWHNTLDEASLVYEDIEEDLHMLKNALINNIFKIKMIEGVVKNYRALWDHLTQVLHHTSITMSKIVSVISKEFGDSQKLVTDAIRGCIQLMKTGKIPESVQHLWKVIQQSRTYGLLEKGLLDLYNIDPAEAVGIHQIMSKTQTTLKQDLHNLSAYLMQLPEMQKNLDWILQHLNLERLIVQKIEKMIYKTVQESLLLSLEIEPTNVEVILPLRQPVRSLIQGVKSISFNPVPVLDSAPWTYIMSWDHLSWAYYSYWPRRFTDYLPPYNRTAMLVSDHEILTFDGAVLRTPNSHCKVLLLAYGSNSLTMEHLQNLVPSKFILVASGVTVIINHDYSVTINGKVVRETHEAQGEVRVWKNADRIRVETSFMTLSVNQKVRVTSVELVGWTFGQVGGLLGTYDDELGNDWLMPSGTKASSLQELVMSWQEDQHCRTPNITPATVSNTPIKKVVLCQALLGISTHYNSVINPEPFIRICYGASNPCDAVQAYRAMCATKGIKRPIAYVC